MIKHTFFLNKNSVVDLDPEFLFGSGTRENPSGYTTHEITIFKYKMGDFCFWPKETMYQQLRFYFDIFRYYQDFTFLIIAGRFFIMGAAFQWFGRSHCRPLIPLCCFLMVLLPSCLGLVCQEACHCRLFSQIVMVHFHSFVKR